MNTMIFTATGPRQAAQVINEFLLVGYVKETDVDVHAHAAQVLAAAYTYSTYAHDCDNFCDPDCNDWICEVAERAGAEAVAKVYVRAAKRAGMEG